MEKLAQRLASIPATIVIGLTAMLVALRPSASEALQFDRAAIAGGELWRLVTCHVTHWSWEHLQWDLLMFTVLGAACELRNPKQMRWCVAAAAISVTFLVMYFFPEIHLYRGLSGIDTALFTLLAVGLFYDARQGENRLLAWIAGALLGGFAVKTAYEALAGQTYFVDQEAAGFVPLVWDHIVAGVIGSIAALIAPLSQRTDRFADQGCVTARRSATIAWTSSSAVSQEHISRAPPAPMKS